MGFLFLLFYQIISCPFALFSKHWPPAIKPILPENFIFNLPRLKVKVKVAQWCLTLCEPMDSIVHGVFQVRTLEWVGKRINALNCVSISIASEAKALVCRVHLNQF